MSKYSIAAPKPSALVESLRAVGYDFETAVADIIDNSIAASATQVDLIFDWKKDGSSLTITDNGKGMNESELVNAMTLGSVSPLDGRSEEDLGRYGLGLKTASFSQCRLLKVISKTQGEVAHGRQWDLDYISETGEWRLQELSDQEASAFEEQLGAHGTVVIWEKLDHIAKGSVGDTSFDQDSFYRIADNVKHHLAMTFHRFLSQVNGLKITINGRKISAWDPFMVSEPTTQILPDEQLAFKGSYVHVTPYVLPHHSRLTTEKHQEGKGVNGWNAQQGFYVYRNKRLLVAGDWLGLGYLKEEHYKLARIKVDIPNTMDAEWRIDIKKSKATPPVQIRADLKRIAQNTRSRASEIYRHRGKLLTRKNTQDATLVWKRGELNGKAVYRVNMDHPLLKQIMASSEDQKPLKTLLRLVEDTLPTAAIVADWNENPMDAPAKDGVSDVPNLHQMALDSIEILIGGGLTKSQAIEVLQAIEPFSDHPEVLEAQKEAA